MNYLRHDGYRYRHHGKAQPGDKPVAYGHLCHKDRNTDKDSPVTIFFRAGVGYTYEAKFSK